MKDLVGPQARPQENISQPFSFSSHVIFSGCFPTRPCRAGQLLFCADISPVSLPTVAPSVRWALESLSPPAQSFPLGKGYF